MNEVKVMRGSRKHPAELLGPLPGYRHGDAVAYEFDLPESFEPWPGRTRLERTFVLLDIGISFAQPCWQRWQRPDGSVVSRESEGPDSWYVDLISVTKEGDTYTFLDLYIDIKITVPNRGYRVLDLEEYAEALDIR